MKKKILCLVMTMLMVVGASMTAHAEDFVGSDDWAVSFNGEKMESNFSSAEMDETILNIQPGDSMLVKVALSNDSEHTTDWYMTNEVLSSLEDAVTVAEGGAYTYRLTYEAVNGEETVLFDSDVVGGENPIDEEGLHQATDNLEDYFYLDTVKKGEAGMVSLYVELEGETQGNDYQDTLAQVQMNFAVELVEDGTIIETVKTGDASPILMFSLLALISALLIIVLVCKPKKNKNVLALALVVALSFASMGNAEAAEISKDNPYEYKITLYAGNRGEFDKNLVSVVSNNDYVITESDDKVEISNLSAGDVVSVYPQSGVDLTEDKYYVQGIRLSGRDNDELKQTVFVVEDDADYVIAYGIAGNQVEYTVNYVDKDGNVLAESETFYGNIGDKPVVAYKYLDGFVPEVLGFTKTLSEDASENVFTFVYDEAPTPTIILDYISGGESNDDTPQGGADQGDDTQQDDDQQQGGQDDDDQQDHVVDLDDDENVPGANIDVDGDQPDLGFIGAVGIGVAALLALIILVIIMMKKRKEQQ